MKIIVTGRHMELTDGFKSFLTDKINKLSHFYDRITEVDAIVTKDKLDHEVEIIVRADHHNRFVAKDRHAEPHAAADLVFTHLERQLTRHKEKHRNRKHPESGPDPDQARGEAGDQEVS